MKHLTAADAAMLAPTELDRERVIQALCWLGISRELVESMGGVTFEPRSVTFDIHCLAEEPLTTLTVEAQIR